MAERGRLTFSGMRWSTAMVAPVMMAAAILTNYNILCVRSHSDMYNFYGIHSNFFILQSSYLIGRLFIIRQIFFFLYFFVGLHSACECCCRKMVNIRKELLNLLYLSIETFRRGIGYFDSTLLMLFLNSITDFIHFKLECFGMGTFLVAYK